MTVFIGDVHGKYRGYKKIIKECKNTIQVGDMGVGFRRIANGSYFANPPFDLMKSSNARFIRGNHDNPEACKNHKMWIKDGHIEEIFDLGKVMFVGGALSIDKQWRIEGYSWWEDEELSYGELLNLVDKFKKELPDVMVTHECPEEICLNYFRDLKYNYPSRTRKSFSNMWNIHKPKIWVFGHWHKSIDEKLNGTRFVCLNELEYKNIEV